MKTNDHPPEPDAAPHLPSRYDELISECSVLCVMADAMPEHVSDRVKERQRREMGTLRSGNHYLEVQAVAESSIRRSPGRSGSPQTTSSSPSIAARAGSVTRSGPNS